MIHSKKFDRAIINYWEEIQDTFVRNKCGKLIDYYLPIWKFFPRTCQFFTIWYLLLAGNSNLNARLCLEFAEISGRGSTIMRHSRVVIEWIGSYPGEQNDLNW